MSTLSPRLAAIVDALPLAPGMRVLEIGGAPGAAARAVCERIAPDGHILVIDRSPTGVAHIERNAAAEIGAGLLSARQVAAEDVTLLAEEEPVRPGIRGPRRSTRRPPPQGGGRRTRAHP